MDQTLQNDIFKEISKILTKKERFQTIDNYVDYVIHYSIYPKYLDRYPQQKV